MSGWNAPARIAIYSADESVFLACLASSDFLADFFEVFAFGHYEQAFASAAAFP